MLMDATHSLTIMKALSNETRRNILTWLKDAESTFGPQLSQSQAEFAGGICVGSIQEKAGLTQSVISGYLMTMQKAGLLESRRIGQWTYYRRNEACIQAFLDYMAQEL